MTIIDIHTHTRHGSPCSYMEPTELILQAKLLRLDGVCITEHNVTWKHEAIRKLQAEHDLLVIGGAEMSTDCGEVLVFGVHEPMLGVGSIKELRELVNNVGGVMVAAHPFRSDASLPARDDPNLDEALAAAAQRPVLQYVDAMEVFNGRLGKWERDFTVKVAARMNMAGTGGSDAHYAAAVGACYTVFDCNIKHEQDFITAIKQGRFVGRERYTPDW